MSNVAKVGEHPQMPNSVKACALLSKSSTELKPSQVRKVPHNELHKRVRKRLEL